MPNYNAQDPPNSIYPGVAIYLFDAETPTPPQASQQVALAGAYDGAAGTPQDVRVDITYASAPSAVSVEVQTSIDDADANYVTEYTSSNTAGESVKLSALKARFLRVKLSSQTGGGAITAEVLR
ncbi:MAG TPA: hypothetical protein VNJ52_13525 [Patescibacteria group bacterium]|nr:hypothetical protein [Patescibacteria group bacterium]